ncbi:ankyrin repeat domain-containing protein [Rickettsia endosymbiont of Halotydeus destructor]|uniref:ankyrin repeat domain-containing protein n=1 Tax=Rickettsia endosymbiont of Halotydeus destructor TaxID=2996754 RepID=UPI003BB1591B
MRPLELLRDLVYFIDSQKDQLKNIFTEELLDNVISYKLLDNITSLSLDEIKEYFVNNKINIQAQDECGIGFIQHALHNPNFKEVIPYLIKQGANIDQQNNYGYTALHSAASRSPYNFIECIDKMKVLLDNGASRNIENSRGEQPQNMQYVSQEAKDFLISYQVSSNQDSIALGKHNEYAQ